MAITINGKKYANGSALAVLRSAKQLLKDVGWIQGRFDSYSFTEDGVHQWTGFCALGAVRQIDGPREMEARHRLEQCVPDADVPSYNDAPTRTKADVLRLFDRAIRARARRRS